MTLDPGRRKKDFLSNFFDDVGAKVGGVLKDVGEIPIIKDIGKAINSEQIKKDLDKVGADIDGAFKSTKQKNKGILDGGTIPLRTDAPGSGGIASFIDQEDAITLQLVKNLYGTPVSYAGYELQGLGDESTRAWINSADEVIVVVKGTSFQTDKALSNILDDLQIAVSGGCNLAAVASATNVLDDIIEAGYTDITIAGHSLGGAAAFCLGTKYPQTKIVTFNAAAPPTQSTAGPPNSKAYHIVGDIISSHVGAPIVKRIYLVESGLQYDQTPTQLQVDGVIWDDVAYYHTIERFFDHGREFKIVTAQFEQNSLENFAFKDTLLATAVDIAGALSSQALNPFKRIQKLICSNPIPGSQSSRSCKEAGPEVGIQIAGGAIGGALGAVTGLFTSAGALSAPAAVVGAGAGLAVASGEKGLFDFIPGVTEAINTGIASAAKTAPGVINTVQIANKAFASDKIVRGGLKRAAPGQPDSLVKRMRF